MAKYAPTSLTPAQEGISRCAAHADACAPFGFGFAESSLRFASAHFRESAFLREGQSIRRYGALGLVAMPPCANRLRPGGVLPLAASDSLWPRGRHASPLRAIGTCPFLRRAFRAPYGSKVNALALDCAENTFDIRSVWSCPRMAQPWNTMQKCDLFLHDTTIMEYHKQTRHASLLVPRRCGAGRRGGGTRRRR